MKASHILLFAGSLNAFTAIGAEESGYEVFGLDVPYATVRKAINALKPLDDPLPPERPAFVAMLGNLTADQASTLLKEFPGIESRKLTEESTPLRVTVDSSDSAVRNVRITVAPGGPKHSVTHASAHPNGSVLMFAPAAAVPEKYTIYWVRLK